MQLHQDNHILENYYNMFTIIQKSTNENGHLYIESTHFPILNQKLTDFSTQLNNLIDYTLICSNTKTYTELEPNTIYYILLLNNNI